MNKKLEDTLNLHLGKGSQYEFIYELGRLTEKITIYGINSPQVSEYKLEIENKYNISKKLIRGNYFQLQAYLHRLEDKK